MKRFSTTYLLIATAILLQGCATTVDHHASGKRTLLDGSKPLSLDSKQCPRGIGLVRLYKDTLDGNKTRFNAKMAYATKDIEPGVNVYNLLDENREAKAKADISTTNNSIMIKLSSDLAPQSSGKFNAITALRKNSDGESVNINDEISIRYNPAKSYYENWGELKNGVLSEMDTAVEDKAILHSVYVKIADKYTPFPIPDTIDGDATALDQKFEAVIGTPMELKLKPKENSAASIIYVQFTNGKRGKANETYNFVADETAEGVKVPTTGVTKGEYVMNIFRSVIMPVDVDEKAEGAQNFCMEVGTGAMGRVNFSEPEATAKK